MRPILAEARGLLVGGADVQREHGLCERDGVGERVQRGEVEHRDGHDGEAVHLGRVVLRLGQARRDFGASRGGATSWRRSSPSARAAA